MTTLIIIFIILLGAIVGFVMIFGPAWLYSTFDLWIKATSSNVPINMWQVMGMRFRNVPPEPIISNMIRAQKAGFKLIMTELENHIQAKGNIAVVIDALIKAQNAGIRLDFRSIGQIDLAGKDVMRVVNMVVQARNAGLNLDIGSAFQIELSGRDLQKVVNVVIKARGSGIDLRLDKAVEIDQSGRDVQRVLETMIRAKNSGIDLKLEKIIQFDLAGIDIESEVNAAIKTKIINSEDIRAITGDGVEVIFRADITVKTNMNDLLGGAGDGTLSKRIEQRLVEEVSSLPTFSDVLKGSTDIARIFENHVQKEELEKDTKYFLVSVEIVDIHVGSDVGAKLELEQLAADAERKKQNATSKRFEMEILNTELAMEHKKEEIEELKMRHKLMAAEAEVQKALAEAFKSGNFGAMDYYRLKNLQADTKMRNTMSEDVGGNEEKPPAH